MSWLSTGEAPEFAEKANFWEDGELIVKKVTAEEIETSKLKVGAQEKPEGITIYDKATGLPYCSSVINGVAQLEPGVCDAETPAPPPE